LSFLGINLAAIVDRWGKSWAVVKQVASDIWEGISKILKDGVEAGTTVLAKFTKPFDDIKAAIKDVIDWVQRFIDKITRIEIPDILRQHSPSMLEQSILDVGYAFGMASGASDNFNSAIKDTRGIGLSNAPNAVLGGTSTSQRVPIVVNVDARGSNWTEEQFRDRVLKTLNNVIDGASNADRFAGLG